MAIPICDELRQRVIFMGQELQNAQVNITHFSSSSYSSHSPILHFKSFLKMTSPTIFLKNFRIVRWKSERKWKRKKSV